MAVKLEDLTNAPLPRLPRREPASHKGDYGRALLVGGSRGMSGAIALAGMAALRSGAGLVTLAVPRSVQDVVAAIEPSYMTFGLADDDGHIDRKNAVVVISLAAGATAVALGPGLGRSDALTDFVARLYTTVVRPMIVDADALVALADQTDALAHPGGPRVLTPHPGEFARLTGQSPDAAGQIAGANDRHRSQAAAELATRDSTGKTVVVLKGHRTVVADRHRASVNQTGNPGMATGGSGDSLTGIITALVCQSLSPWDAARLGVHVHGLAGDLAARQLGQVSLVARDIIDYLPTAFGALSAQHEKTTQHSRTLDET
jgi:ADP-dependent NAD(P)H-hydrate dehydratase